MTKQITTKDPKAVERGRKGWETQLEKIRVKHLEEIKNGNTGGDTSNNTGNNTGSDTGSTGNDTGNSILPQNYYGGAGIFLVAGIAIFYFWNNKTTPEKTPPPTRPNDDDFFKMN